MIFTLLPCAGFPARTSTRRPAAEASPRQNPCLLAGPIGLTVCRAANWRRRSLPRENRATPPAGRKRLMGRTCAGTAGQPQFITAVGIRPCACRALLHHPGCGLCQATFSQAFRHGSCGASAVERVQNHAPADQNRRPTASQSPKTRSHVPGIPCHRPVEPDCAGIPAVDPVHGARTHRHRDAVRQKAGQEMVLVRIIGVKAGCVRHTLLSKDAGRPTRPPAAFHSPLTGPAIFTSCRIHSRKRIQRIAVTPRGTTGNTPGCNRPATVIGTVLVTLCLPLLFAPCSDPDVMSLVAGITAVAMLYLAVLLIPHIMRRRLEQQTEPFCGSKICGSAVLSA